MGDDRATMQHYAYHTNKDSRLHDWVQSTSFATSLLEESADQPLHHSPDDFYSSSYHPRPSEFETPSDDMTSAHQRPPNPTKPSVRSVSGPASSSIASMAATRAAQLPVNRPTVKSLAQRFNQPSSAEPSPPSTRVRTSRPASSTRSITEAPARSASITSSPARPSKEAAYGSHKFNNLKPRERPQPAPASPASVRRTHDRTSRDEQTTPSRRKPSPPTRGQTQRASTGRQPFFGEVVGEHDETTPGFGIPSAEPSINDTDPVKMPSADKSTIKLVDDDSHASPKAPYIGHLPVKHGRFPSDMTSRSAREGQQAESPRQREIRKHSPPSRIPVATRHRSGASDSGSSTRSSKASSTRPSGDYARNSPVRSNGLANANGSANFRKPKPQTPQSLPAATYRGYRERGKSPQGAGAGTSLAAVITAPPPPASPRLRNSRERQLLTSQESSEATIRSVDASEGEDFFEDENGLFGTQNESYRFLSEGDQMISLLGSNVDSSVESSADTVGVPSSQSLRPEQSTNELDSNSSMAHQPSLVVHTSGLLVPHIPAPLSATTDFEQDESPILGMPGSFMMTPPVTQYTPPIGSGVGEEQHVQSLPNNTLPGELLQARAFRPITRSHTADAHDSLTSLTAPSDLGFRESIPIMLGVDEQQPDWAAPTIRLGQSSRLSIGAHRWRTEPLDSSGTISYLDEDDSPIDPFANRESLRPEDSASVAFYKQTEYRTPDWTPKMPSTQESKPRHLTMDSEAYSVINKVLNLYHESSIISPEVAYDSRKQVCKVSPVIAQHEDWGSKEATETYLARLLSDAAVTDERNGTEPAVEETNHKASHQVPSLSIRELDEDPEEHTGGTAIIFPPESRRYSRGSRGSTTTTIYDDGSRADSSSVNLARDSARDEFTSHIHLPASTYAPHPPPKDWQASHHAETSNITTYQQRSSHDRLAQSFGSLLPEIEGAGEGLGLSLQAKQPHSLGAFHYPTPPRPSYSPPPPPLQYAPPPPPIQYAPPPPPIQHAPPPPPIQHPIQPSFDQTTTAPAPHTPSVHNRQLPSKMGVFSDSYEVPDDTIDGISGEHPIHQNDASDPVEPRDPFRGSTDAGALQPVLTSNSDTAPPAAGVTTKDADPVTQALKQRYRVMAELIKTEQLFCVDMMVAYSVFEATSHDCLTDRERRTLFCNSQDIDKLSHELYQDLKRAARPVVNPQKSPAERQEERDKKIAGGEEVEDEEIIDDGTWDEFKCVSVETDRQTRIGEVMNEHMPQIERLFTIYLLNHADASNFIKSKSDDGGVLGWVQACFVHSKDLTNAWDLDSLLVKPVQRLMKYPLLLDSLEKATTTDHPDYAAIKAARAEIVEVNVRINQAKKRQETLREATKEGKKQKNKGTFENRLGKTFFVKPFSSKVDKSKQPTGSSALVFSDDEYDFLAQKFGGHFFQIQVVMRDINTYLDTMTEFMCNTNCLVLTFIALMESAPSSHPEIESSWRRQAMAFFELQQVALEDHKSAVRSKVQNIIVELWGLHGRPQKLMDQRKKGLQTYLKYKQALERKEKIDPKLEDAGQSFIAINTTLKIELPKLYDLTKKCVRACLGSFVSLQKEWWKNCQKKILPLLEYEPEHTTSITFDLKAYVDRFHSDFASVEAVAGRLAIANRGLLTDVQNYASPLPTYVDDSSSSRKSTSRRTESMSSDASLLEPRKRYSGGYSQRTAIPPRSSPAIHTMLARERDRALSPNSDRSDNTIGHTRRQTATQYTGLDGAFDTDFGPTSSMGSSLLYPNSNPGSSRTSGVFSSALPMSSSDFSGSHETAPTTPATPTDLDEPEVLFLAASLFEFNIAHDRREGGIPYLVYVPGEIFDVIGMKGELWLARNQDDSTRTVGWIWEKHFARILPEDG